MISLTWCETKHFLFPLPGVKYFGFSYEDNEFHLPGVMPKISDNTVEFLSCQCHFFLS